MALAHLMLWQLTHIYSPSLSDITRQRIHYLTTILAQSTIYVPLKALPVLVCTKNISLSFASGCIYPSTYPHAVFSIHTHGSALSNI